MKTVCAYVPFALRDGCAQWTGSSESLKLVQLLRLAWDRGHLCFLHRDGATVKVTGWPRPDVPSVIMHRRRCFDQLWLSSEGWLSLNAVLQASPPPLSAAIIVLNVAALHWYEAEWAAGFMARYTRFIAQFVDHVVTSNSRMAGYLEEWLRREVGMPAARIHTVELGNREPVCHATPETWTTLINTGGVWKWTDVCTFLSAFCTAAREFPHLRFIQVGLCLPKIRIHDEYIRQFQAIVDANQDLVARGNLVIIPRWLEPHEMEEYLRQSDIGLNMNKPTFENLQSNRVRLSDYRNFGLAILSTFGDEWSERLAAARLGFQAAPGCQASVADSLRHIAQLSHADLADHRRQCCEFYRKFTWARVGQPFIDRMATLGARSPKPAVPQNTQPQTIRNLRQRLKKLQAELARHKAAVRPVVKLPVRTK